jgi:MerR family transcriptional regulator, light-induced transcriptional regulator
MPAGSPIGPRAPEGPQLGVAAAARKLGIAPATLRTWDRRYGLGPSEHMPGRHRRYSAEDVARLELMQRALVGGASPADAARYATTARLATAGPGEPIAVRATPPAAVEGNALAADRTDRTDHDEGDGLGDRDRDGGGRAERHVRAGGMVLRLSGAGRCAQGLARAALALDSIAVRRLLDESVATVGVETTWDESVRPVLGAVAERWVHSGAGVEIEHLLSECVSSVFAAQAAAAVTAAGARPVLLAGMPGEQHILPVVVLCAALARRGVPCRSLGANLPVTALAAAVRRTAPSVVVLWSQVAASADVGALESLPRTRPRFRTFVAGPGWAAAELPARVDWLTSLATAREAISDAVPV